MNNFKQRFAFSVAALVLTVILASCGGSFLNTEPTDSIGLNSFYKTNEQVKASTNILYGAPWFGWNNKSSWALTAESGGNGRSFSSDVDSYLSYATQANNAVMNAGWSSLWTVVGQANALINNLQKRAGSDVDQAVINNALGEAHVLRATAYFYLVRSWGPVPIIKNNLNHVEDPNIPLNRVQDVYIFMRNDLQFGIENCKNVASGLNGGHVTSGSAKALLAKVALYDEDYETAQQMSQEVIDNGEFHLLDDYSNLFKVQYNNNPETIIAMQWSDAGYGTGNSIQASWAYESKLTGTGGGYAVLGPTIDLQRAYENGDKRRKPTIMLAGAHYPGLLSDDGGYTVPDDVNAQGTDAAMKKYVVGTPTDQGGQGTQFSSVINTYILRYADVLLINAEAKMKTGNGDPTTPFNKVRARAGLSDKSSLSMDDILHERRIELAFECDYWYDLGRIDRQKAINMISNQEIGTFNHTPRQNPPDIESISHKPQESDFTLPYPADVTAVNDHFTEDPVTYDFENSNNSQ